MPRYFVVDARFSMSNDPNSRSGSISISSLGAFPASPVNRFAQSMGPERTNPASEPFWTRHTTPAMSTRRYDFVLDDPWDFTYAAKSNRRSVWRRFAENVDKCVFRVMSKFYK
ncbi:uncharacterized protein PITG_16840 [Phytophthora infestans T30-4]|uniref:Uncharacterized protein n=1 Tax=Phytophthora infestans (strain T30-4) TaxID=403677 RepID=D0NU83_PHYIT|nr:uncharacterized protein PITG_16840 [Phytophthora infestans T30-4]EEY65216.1 conserved hypothetical protein [Phytophthora infestans T30-4]|eukprot:XP_002897280.1 conserved hypothetical protein [Phytophthora infestans T30-4]